jgi:hypothetical protein
MRSRAPRNEKPLHWICSSFRTRSWTTSGTHGDDASGAFRAVYTVRFRKAIYVLHAFQKKSPSGIPTARQDVELVRERLKSARQDYEARYGKEAN